MKKSDAETEVVRLWREWPGRDEPPSPAKGLLFYGWLGSEHSYALSFRASADKWQVISGWLNRHNLR